MRVVRVCREQPPLTAPVAVEDRVDGLLALARHSAPARAPVPRSGDVTLDPARRAVERAGRPVHLTPQEFVVLEQLPTASGDVVSAEVLLDKAWDERADPFTNAVRITAGTLRRKLGEPPVVRTSPARVPVHAVTVRLTARA